MNALSLALLLATPQSGAEFATAWDSIQNAIETRFYARATRKAEMSSRLNQYEPKAKGAKSMEEFGDVVNQMIAEFEDSHFNYFTSLDQGYYFADGIMRGERSEKAPWIGAWFRKGQDGYTVQMVLNDSEAARAGLRKGDVVMTVDGDPFSPIRSLRSRADRPVSLKVKRGGQELTKQVKVSLERPLESFLSATQKSARVIESGGKRYGYIHLWTQLGQGFRDALEAAVYGKLARTDGFILDLRDGFGGRPEGFADPFFRPGSLIETGIGNQRSAQIFGYSKPLVVIVNGGSRSAKEVLAIVLKKSGRATLVGSRTTGAVLATFPARVNDWSILQVPAVEMWVDGVRLEDNGVEPDVKVEREFDDSGRDLYIDAAIATLSKNVG